MRPVQSILCPVDLQRPSDAALRYAFFLAEAFYASLDVVLAREPDSQSAPGSGPDSRAAERVNDRLAREYLDGLLRTVTTAIPGRASTHVVEGAPVSGVLRSALRFRSDLIVVGSHFESQADWHDAATFGEQLAYAAACAVLSVREDGRRTAMQVRHILLPVHSHHSTVLAVNWTAAFAGCFGATVELLGCTASPDHDEDADDAQAGEAALLEDVRDRFRIAGVGVEKVTTGAGGAFERILKRTESGGCDLVVMGAESRSKRMSVTEPSLTASIRRHASIPVLSVRPPGSPSAVRSRNKLGVQRDVRAGGPETCVR